MRAALLLLAACDALSADPGLTAQLQVTGAQFRPGPFPGDEGGPATIALETRHSVIIIDRNSESMRGILETPSRAAVVGIDGVDGAWIIVAANPDLDTPNQPTAKARLGVAAGFPPGPFDLIMRASDASGRFGAAATRTIMALDEEPPTGELVIGLSWEGAADLDLHVVDPLGGEAWSDDPNTVLPPPPGTSPDPDAWKAGGILDHDGNKDCRRDGRPKEHVVWMMPPPAGEYIVRVDTRRMCGDPAASWYAFAMRGEKVLGEVRGVATPDDVTPDVDGVGRRGKGVLAFRFTLP